MHKPVEPVTLLASPCVLYGGFVTINSANRFGSPTWTEQKLTILEQYMKQYTTALKNRDFHLTYVDAFAGTGFVSPTVAAFQHNELSWGDSLDDSSRNLLVGSTRRAVAVADKPFDTLIFVEQNGSHAAALRRIRTEFPSRDIRIEQSDANSFLQMWCDHQNESLGIPWDRPGHRQRAVVFLDPFATQVHWTTVAAVASTQSIDLWILFPLSALTRIMPRDREPEESWAQRLDEVYGGSEWRTLYQTRIRRTLFGDETEMVRADQQAIVQVYLDKLSTIFPYVSKSPKWFNNSRNSPLFAFLFAAANPGRGGEIALRIANYLLNRW